MTRYWGSTPAPIFPGDTEWTVIASSSSPSWPPSPTGPRRRFEGRRPGRPRAPPPRGGAQESARLPGPLEALGEIFKSDIPLREISTEQLLQGPLADTLTHVGQLAMLRRLAGSPIAPENFIYADIRPDRLGVLQAPPERPAAHWPERLA